MANNNVSVRNTPLAAGEIEDVAVMKEIAPPSGVGLGKANRLFRHIGLQLRHERRNCFHKFWVPLRIINFFVINVQRVECGG